MQDDDENIEQYCAGTGAVFDLVGKPSKKGKKAPMGFVHFPEREPEKKGARPVAKKKVRRGPKAR